MRDSVPSPRYSAICNVLRQWKTSLIPTYRVYRLYDVLRMVRERHVILKATLAVYISCSELQNYAVL